MGKISVVVKVKVPCTKQAIVLTLTFLNPLYVWAYIWNIAKVVKMVSQNVSNTVLAMPSDFETQVIGCQRATHREL